MLKGLLLTARKYPKTSVFLTGISLYVGNHLRLKNNDNLLRHRICNQLSGIGMKPLQNKDNLLRVTVFLNPFAHQKAILEKFDENAMPLLQISGLDVQMVYLDDDEDVKKLTDVLDPASTDAIIVAGDDNLFAKALTGLLRRTDYVSTNLWKIPVYVLPLGIFNNYCSSVWKENNIIKWCYRMIEPVLEKKSARRNVLNICPLIQSSEGDSVQFQADEKKQAIFAMTGVEWSCWRDVEYGGGGTSLTAARPSTYKPRLVPSRCSSGSPDISETVNLRFYTPKQCFKRFWARIRHGWSYLRAPAFDPSPPSEDILVAAKKKRKAIRRGCAKQATLIVKPACPGCKKCWTKKCKLAEFKTVSSTTNRSSWLSYIFGFSYSAEATTEKAVTKIQPPGHENPDCGSEIHLNVPLASRIVLTLFGDYVRVNVSPAAQGLVDYVKQAMEHLTSPTYHCDTVLTAIPDPGASNHNEMSFLCSSVILCPSRTDGEFFWIDNDGFEACPIEVSVLKDAVNSFPSAQDFSTQTIPYST